MRRETRELCRNSIITTLIKVARRTGGKSLPNGWPFLVLSYQSSSWVVCSVLHFIKGSRSGPARMKLIWCDLLHSRSSAMACTRWDDKRIFNCARRDKKIVRCEIIRTCLHVSARFEYQSTLWGAGRRENLSGFLPSSAIHVLVLMHRLINRGI